MNTFSTGNATIPSGEEKKKKHGIGTVLHLPMMWILLTKPMQKSVTTVCLHCSFARLKIIQYNTIQYKKHLDAPFPKGSEGLQRKTLILQDKITIVIKCIYP